VFDRLLGGFFALLKGALFLGFALMVLSLFLPPDAKLLKESRTAPILMRVSRQALEYLPQDFKKRWERQLEEWLKPRKKQRGQLSRTSSAKDQEYG